MKIVVDILPIKSDGSAGGAVGFTIQILNELVGKFEIIALCTQKSKSYLGKMLDDRIKLKTVKYYKVTRSLFYLKKQGDVLFCPFGAINFYNRKVPIVSTVLDIQHEYYPHFFDEAELLHRQTFYKRIVKQATKVVCISDYTRETFCEKYGFSLKDSSTIYIPIPNPKNKDENVLQKYNLQVNKYILYPANFWKHKNHKKLLLALKKYLDSAEDKRYKLVLTGNTLDAEGIVNEIEVIGLAENVVITGYVDESEVISLLKSSKGLIFPSLFEGFGIPIVEAMAANKLIACSNVTSLPEIGADTIFYFDPNKIDEIVKGIEFLLNNDVDENIIRSYENKLKLFNKDIIEKKYEDIFYAALYNKEK